ncbi:hypothetical protein G6F68_019003 [Rhizopus microsporus]|nr:hypothetical protein G6F68_019003 [Rhizopus microsporus]
MVGSGASETVMAGSVDVTGKESGIGAGAGATVAAEVGAVTVGTEGSWTVSASSLGVSGKGAVKLDGGLGNSETEGIPSCCWSSGDPT